MQQMCNKPKGRICFEQREDIGQKTTGLSPEFWKMFIRFGDIETIENLSKSCFMDSWDQEPG